MKVVEINEGTKIPYTVDGNYINFNDDFIINLAKREDDVDVQIDICSSEDGQLMNAIKGNCAYVATIDIPARTYTETTTENEDGETATTKEAVAFDIDNVTLTLWALVNYEV